MINPKWHQHATFYFKALESGNSLIVHVYYNIENIEKGSYHAICQSKEIDIYEEMPHRDEVMESLGRYLNEYSD